ncbi:MAG: iron chelate uptake ABC transporter family permease subunit [Candidatus Thiodiazotropha sp.]
MRQQARVLLTLGEETASAMGGALLLMLADMGVRLMPVQGEIKVGVVTSLIGAPFFLWLILHHRGRGS